VQSIVETAAGTVTSTKQFVWCGGKMCEARNASSAVTAQYFPLGEMISGTSYYCTMDHLGSIREMTNSSGAVVAQYSYNAYGQVTKIQGSQSSDFQYAGYYYHAPSGLNLTLNRAYNASLGRWINRDPIGELGGINLFAYVLNSPINQIDPYGTQSNQAKKNCPSWWPPLRPSWWPKNWAWPWPSTNPLPPGYPPGYKDEWGRPSAQPNTPPNTQPNTQPPAQQPDLTPQGRPIPPPDPDIQQTKELTDQEDQRIQQERQQNPTQADLQTHPEPGGNRVGTFAPR